MSTNEGIAPNAKRLLLAGFMAILAAGVGFSVRGGILGDWGTQFGFTQSDLGGITGGGLTGFGVIILLGALIADKIGYGKLIILAFLMHFLSAVLTLAATPVYESMKATNPVGAHNAVYWLLYVGMFMFAIGNGLCEAVVNPLVATLFPKNKAHYLNILHAGWPAGLVLGGLASAMLAGHVRWEVQMSLFLIPVLFYGILCFRQHFPKSEAASAGVSFGQMLAQFAAPLLILLLFIHALLGYVELGTDSWISNITGNIVGSKQNGLYLFVYTSSLMFILRFCAGPIVEKISPLGLLFVGACCGCAGLTLLSGSQTIVAVIIALTVYGVGKTFLWPTMLAVASERFPKGGALVIGAMGGVGMLSAGMLGGPGIGYNQDRAASEHLKETNPAAYAEYKAGTSNSFLFFKQITGLDGSKVTPLRETGVDGVTLKKGSPEVTVASTDGLTVGRELVGKGIPAGATITALGTNKKSFTLSASATEDVNKGSIEKKRTATEAAVHDADLVGGRMALKITALIPATMATLYLLLLIFFRLSGGYKTLHVTGEQETGGVEGAMEA